MNRARTASFLLAAAALGSLIAAVAAGLIPAILASATVLGVSCAAFRVLGQRAARKVQARIEVLGQPFLDVLVMVSCGVVRKAYVRDEVLAGGEEAAA